MAVYEGKNVVITGGSSGVGLSTAKLFAGGGAVTVRGDAASLRDVDALVDRAKAELGHVDALFVNAG